MLNIPVKCTINRFWDTTDLKWRGETVYGTLITVSTLAADDILVPVGIILLDNNTFESVPMEFIEKYNDQT